MKDNYISQCEVCWTQTAHDLLYKKWGYSILHCRVCSLGSTYTGDGFNPASIYSESYFQGGRKDGYADYVGSERVLREEFRRALAHLRHYGPAEGRLLEVGSAYGFFLSEAERYFKCTGVEISEAATHFCRSRGLNVHCGKVSADLLNQCGPLDAAVMLDCIEHLANPSEVLTLLWRALRENGALMIATGDWDSLLSRAMGQRWRLMTPPQHLFYFSRRTLRMLLEKIGFRVVSFVRPWKLVPLGLAAYQLGNRLGHRVPFLESLSSLKAPINLFDSMRLVALKDSSSKDNKP